jgi:hypothetical protein
LLHDAQVGVSLEHVFPFLHTLEYLALDLLVGVAVGSQTKQSVGEGAGGQLAMDGTTTVLRQGIGELERVQLDVGIAVGEALDQGSRDRLRACRRGGHAIAHIQDEGPVLRGQILVGCLGCYGSISTL